MNPAIFGTFTALSWGSADFIARFSGRALGHETAVFGMLAVSAPVLTLVAWQAGLPFLLGSRPSLTQWAGIAVVAAGVVAVARASKSYEAGAGYSAEALRKTILITLLAALMFAVSLAAGQAAAPIYGELQTLWIARWIGLAAIALLLFGVRRSAPGIPLRWWPVLTVQGLLDGGAYLAIFASGHLPNGEIAIVVGSTYCAVTAILAKVFLREAMTALQWLGIVLIVGGVAALSG